MKKVLMMLTFGSLILFTYASPADDFDNFDKWVQGIKRQDREFERLIDLLEAGHRGESANKVLIHKELVKCKNNPKPTEYYSERVHKKHDKIFHSKMGEVREKYKIRSKKHVVLQSKYVHLKRDLQKLETKLQQCKSNTKSRYGSDQGFD